jgi:regulator of protease activity HflC (stomatin/prohibitin superfamily)
MNIASFFQGLVILVWVGVVALIAVIVTRASRNAPSRGLGRSLLILVIFALLLSTVSAGLVFIDPQERGVVISALSGTGYREQALQPGLRWVIPFAENVIRYPISRQTYTMSIAAIEGERTGDDSILARTADGQEVVIDASIIFYIDPEKVTQVHIAWQTRYTEDLIRPLVRGVIRDAVSQFGIEEVYSSRRAELSAMVTEALAIRLSENGLALQEFILRNISFSQEYAASVEQKQIAEQQAQQARFVVEQRRQEAEQARQVAEGRADASVIAARGEAEARLIQAEAEADALELIAAALDGKQDLLNYQYVTRLSPNVQVMLVPNDQPFLMPFPGMSAAGPVVEQVPTSPAAPAPQPEPTPTTPVTP